MYPLVQNRIDKWHKQAKNRGWDFSYEPIDGQSVKVKLLTLPKETDLPFRTTRINGEQLKEKLQNFRYLQLEKLGSNLGIYRTPESVAKKEFNIFAAYDV